MACGATSPKWQGRCPSCGDWNSLQEELAQPRLRRVLRSQAGETLSLAAIAPSREGRGRSGLAEVDRVLGGGLVPGSVVLLGGDPGIGKSTLALQIARGRGLPDNPALYCAGEESADQLALRARRVGCASDAVHVLVETDLEAVLATIVALRPPVAVIDSVQTLHDPGVPGAPGSPSQVREAVMRVAACAKASDVPVVLVGHVTKEGAIAGPRTLEHMVDVVLYLEGDRLDNQRLLRGIKNRFGSTGEMGLLTMDEDGIRELDAPGRAFIDDASLDVAGSVLAVTCEGARPLAVEVQALTVRSYAGLPRRTASGFDLNRLLLLLAVLEKRAGVKLGQHDVFVNVVGGVRIADPGVDLAVALAIAGSAKSLRVPGGWAVLGEVGLAGEVRRVRRMEQRLGEAGALGISEVICPQQPRPAPGVEVRIRGVRTVEEAVACLAA